MIVSSEGFKPTSCRFNEKCSNAIVTIASTAIKNDFLNEYNSDEFYFDETFKPMKFVSLEEEILVVSVPPSVEGIDSFNGLLAVIEGMEKRWYKYMEPFNKMLFESIVSYNESGGDCPDGECNECGGCDFVG